MEENKNNGNLDNIRQTTKEYINLRIDQYKLKGVENLSLLSNKALVVLVITVLCIVILQLLGFAASFFIGELLGNTALGFAAMSLIFVLAIVVIYTKRDSLFLNKMVRMYMKMLFSDDNIQ